MKMVDSTDNGAAPEKGEISWNFKNTRPKAPKPSEVPTSAVMPRRHTVAPSPVKGPPLITPGGSPPGTYSTGAIVRPTQEVMDAIKDVKDAITDLAARDEAKTDRLLKEVGRKEAENENLRQELTEWAEEYERVLKELNEAREKLAAAEERIKVLETGAGWSVPSTTTTPYFTRSMTTTSSPGILPPIRARKGRITYRPSPLADWEKELLDEALPKSDEPE